MKRFKDVLSGLMLIGSTIITVGIVFVGVFLFIKSSSFIPLSLIFVLVFLVLYTLRAIYIGINIMFFGRYKDDTIFSENFR